MANPDLAAALAQTLRHGNLTDYEVDTGRWPAMYMNFVDDEAADTFEALLATHVPPKYHKHLTCERDGTAVMVTTHPA
jgi:hypothetical protein